MEAVALEGAGWGAVGWAVVAGAVGETEAAGQARCRQGSS